MEPRHAIIIGSGVGGSAIGALLSSKENFKVTLLEQSNLIGGRFATYEKDGFKMDIGCHLLANCDKGPLGKVLEICGCADYVKWCHARKQSPVINYKGEDMRIPREMEKLGLSQEDIENFMRFQVDIRRMTPEECEKYDNISIRDFISRYTDSDLTRSLVGLFAAIYFVDDADVLPLGEYARCQNEVAMNKTMGYPVGGTGAIPEAYCRIIEETGGSAMTETGVKRIIIKDGQAVGVELLNGKVIEADLVISNASYRDTALSLVGAEHYPDDVVKQINRYEYSNAPHVLKIALDKPITDHQAIFYLGTDSFMEFEERERSGDVPEKASSLMIPIISNLDPESAPVGKQLIYAGCSCHSPHTSGKEVLKKWDASILNALKDVFPNIEDHIMWTVSTSSAAIHNMFGEEGCVIGLSQKIDQAGEKRLSVIDPVISNLYHCSADTGLHGIGGDLAADAALRLYDSLITQD